MFKIDKNGNYSLFDNNTGVILKRSTKQPFKRFIDDVKKEHNVTDDRFIEFEIRENENNEWNLYIEENKQV